MTFYNEFDRHKAAWLRELANSGEITNGDVDERSIKDLRADDVAGYNRAHFFAGIGVWDYAMRLAGWPARWPAWSASCPCQPFSSAGRRKGTEDDRHLWPWLMGLIAERHPHVVIGEQVSSPDGLAWFDIVRTDLEAEGYACGSLDTCAAGVGAPHARQRLYWCALRLDGLADLPKPRLEERRDGRSAAGSQRAASERSGGVGLLGHATGRGCGERGDAALAGSGGHADGAGGADGVGDNESERCGEAGAAGGRPAQWADLSGFTRGHWAGADWVLTRPQRVGDHPGLRPVEPRIISIPHEPSAGMGFGGDQSAQGDQRQEGEVNDQFKTDAREILRGVPGANGKKAHQREAGGLRNLLAQEILQPNLHGGWPEEGSGAKPILFEGDGSPDSQGLLRGVREARKIACAPQRRKSTEQSSVEFADFVRLLPSARALAKLYGDTNTEKRLSAMLSPLGKEWALLYASKPAEEVWRSLPEEVQNRVRVGFASGGWRRSGCFPLAEKQEARVMRLKGYGDAIVANQAAAFIRCVMEEILERTR